MTEVTAQDITRYIISIKSAYNYLLPFREYVYFSDLIVITFRMLFSTKQTDLPSANFSVSQIHCGVSQVCFILATLFSFSI